MWIDKNGNPSPGWIMVNVAEEGEEPRYLKCVNPTPEQYRENGWTWQEPQPPEPQPENPDFAAVKAAFWGYVDDAAAALSEATGAAYTRADFPTGAFSPELLAWCTQHGMTEEQTGALAVKFYGIAADLARLGRNWNELFDEVQK